MKTLEVELKHLNQYFEKVSVEKLDRAICLRLIKCLEKAVEQRDSEIFQNEIGVPVDTYDGELLSILEGRDE